MSQYQPKPVVVDAYRVGGDEPEPGWLLDHLARRMVQRSLPLTSGEYMVRTTSLIAVARSGSWIMRDAAGGLTVMSDSDFTALYMPVIAAPPVAAAASAVQAAVDAHKAQSEAV